MRLMRLEIQALPGIEPGFTVTDIDPGMNLVTGPNTVGKSSLLRALRALVAEPAPGESLAMAVAGTLVNGGRWVVRRSGSHQTWELDGRAVERPALPASEDLHCYWLSMENLLLAEAGDQRLVTALRRALAGGFDLRALRGGEFDPGPRAGYNEQRTLREARATLRAAEQHYETLRHEEQALPGLIREMEAARDAAQRAARLARALDWADARAALGSADAALATFPAGMEHLHGTELEELERIDARRAEAAGLQAVAERQRADSQAALESSGLVDARPSAASLEAWRQRLEAAQHRRNRLLELNGDLARARARESTAREALGGGQDPPGFKPDDLQRAEKLARTLDARQRLHDELAERVRSAPEAPPEDELERHVRATEALRAWLAAAAVESGRPKLPYWLAALGGALVTGYSAWVADWPAAWPAEWPANWPVLAGGILVMAAAGWGALAGRRTARQAAQAQLAAAGMTPPDGWTAGAVRERLACVEQEHAALREQRARALASIEDRRRVERVTRELEVLEAERAALGQALGFDPGLAAIGVDHFARYVGQWSEARRERLALEQTVAELATELEVTLRGAREFLAPWETDETPDRQPLAPVALSVAVQALAARLRNAEAAEQRLYQADQELQRLAQVRQVLDDDEARLFAKAGLERGARDALRDRLARLDSWRDARDRHLATVQREAEARRRAADDPELAARAERSEIDALATLRSEAERDAARLESLQAAFTRTQTRLEDAGADRRLAAAAGRVDAARAALQDRREEVMLATAAHCLLDEIEEAHRSEHEPALLRDARERFRGFTHHAWDLALDDERGLEALDCQQGVRRTLAELSSGTRMQLLLAVRLAWIRSLELGRASLPLFLDEALTTSDESRFASVARSVQQLVDEEQRQVFYLSARRQEVELWAHATGRRPHHIDLAAVRFGASAATPIDLAVPPEQVLPTPAGHDAASYGALLGVPAVDPRRPDEALHLFHLLRDDLPLLHRLLEAWSTRSTGQLETLLQSSAAKAAVPDARLRRTLAERGEIQREWARAWRRGRGRPIDRAGLEASDKVSTVFIDQATALAAELDGDAQALVAAMRDGRLPRFRNVLIEELAQWLEIEGYIDPAGILDAAGRERHVLLTLGDRVDPVDIRRTVSWLEAGLA